MNGLSALVLSLCSLIEAEGRLLQENVLRSFLRLLLLLAGVLFGVAAIAFFIAGIYSQLALFMPSALALACVGLISAFVSFIFFWSSGQWGKRKAPSAEKSSPE